MKIKQRPVTLTQSAVAWVNKDCFFLIRGHFCRVRLCGGEKVKMPFGREKAGKKLKQVKLKSITILHYSTNFWVDFLRVLWQTTLSIASSHTHRLPVRNLVLMFYHYSRRFVKHVKAQQGEWKFCKTNADHLGANKDSFNIYKRCALSWLRRLALVNFRTFRGAPRTFLTLSCAFAYHHLRRCAVKLTVKFMTDGKWKAKYKKNNFHLIFHAII